jgi:hypothetical protein
MNESPKQQIKWKKSDIKEYTFYYDSVHIHLKAKPHTHKFMVIEWWLILQKQE